MESVKFFKLSPLAKSPTRANATDAGLDLYAVESTFIGVNKTAVVKHHNNCASY